MRRQFDRGMGIGVECDDSAAIAKIFNVLSWTDESLFISFAWLPTFACARKQGYTRTPDGPADFSKQPIEFGGR
jgi:hypothetical protein